VAINKILTKDEETFSLAFSDSSGDFFMLKRANKGFLFQPHEDGLALKAKELGINVVDDTSIIEVVKQSLV